MDKKFTTLVATSLIIVSLLVVNSIFKLDLGNKLGTLFVPVEIVFGDLGSSTGSFFSGIGKIAGLEKENNDLKKKLSSEIAEVAALNQAKLENESLRKDLNFSQNTDLSLVSGEIATFDPTLKNGINVHVTDSTGIKKGNIVIAEGFMIGKVDSISGNIVKVNLLTDPTSAIPVMVQGKEIAGVAKGQIGNGLTFDQVPQGESVSISDIVVTSGLGGDLPAGIALAKVSGVTKVSGSIFQQIDLTPLVDVLSVHFVMIAK